MEHRHRGGRRRERSAHGGEDCRVSGDRGARGGDRRVRQPRHQQQQERQRRLEGQRRGATAIKPGTPGGKLTVLASADVDYLDPGQTYYTFGYMVLYSTNRPLYSFKPDDSAKPVPDLATGPPEISSDNKTITVHIKPERQVRAAGQPRGQGGRTSSTRSSGRSPRRCPAATPAPTSPRSSGRRTKPNTGDIKPISGIETPDDTTIIFHLKTPSAPLVSQALVMPITVPVPQEYASKFDKKNAVDLRPVHDVHRPLYGQERPQTGKVTGRVAGQVDRHRPQPQLGQVDRLPARLPRRGLHPGGQRRPRHRRAASAGRQRLGLL